MTGRYHEFRGEHWLRQPMQLIGGSLHLVEDSQFGSFDSRMAYARGGKKATVYKVRRNGRHMAMKVFKKRFALSENFMTMMQLIPLKTMPGLRVCDRQIINSMEAQALGEPGLAWAILMPWIEGEPWTAIIEARKQLSQDSCLAMARLMADILAGLEAELLVHADLSSSNVFVQLGSAPSIELIDVEDMYHPAFIDVSAPPDGTPGYAHPANAGKGCWNPYGDRFAGAILLTEMLTWHQKSIREASSADSLFSPEELCHPGAKFTAVHMALRAHSPTLARLFTRAWESAGLQDCPTMSEWHAALAAARPTQTHVKVGTAPPAVFALRPPLIFGVPKFQTSLLTGSRCDECKQWIRDRTPGDHTATCSHHPSKFTPSGDFGSLLSRLTGSPRPELDTDISEVLQRYAPNLTACTGCGRLVAGPADGRHAADCPQRIPSPQSGQAIFGPGTSATKYDDVSFMPFDQKVPFSQGLRDNLSAGWPQICPKCGRSITVFEAKELGHKLTCSEGRIARFLKDL